MVIECPECHVRFKVADEMIGDRPVKLKCGKCKVVFTFSKDASPAPAAPEAPRPAHPVVPPPAMSVPRPAPEPTPAADSGEAASPAEAAPVSLDEAYTSFEKEEEPPEQAPAPAPTEPAPAEPAEQPPATSAEPAAEAPPEPAVVIQAPPAATVQASEPVKTPVRPSRPPVITLEDVLPKEEPPPKAAKAVAITFLVLLGLGLVFAILVLFRNGWDFTLVTSDPFKAVKVAFGTAELEAVAPEARGIEISVYDSYTVVTASKTEVFVVNGEVLNTTVFPKKLVTMEVRIESVSGEVVARQEAMAGITLLTEDQISVLGDVEMQERHLEDSRAAESWVIRSNRKGSFQAIFTTFPPGVGDPALYVIEAKVISAANAGAGEE